MRVVELVQEEHFSEGEPDLEPPEELAVGELDDETMLEEDLDNEDIAEDDVDDDVLTASLEDLVHVDDDVDDDERGEVMRTDGGLESAEDAAALEALEVLDVDEIEDLEESLDRLLARRLAMDGDEAGEDGAEEEGVDPESTAVGDGQAQGTPVLAGVGRPVMAGCSPDEFVCRGCFLVRHRAQLTDAVGGLCRDCAS